jgi:glutamate-1-semialdehyde aminotransferase
MAFFYVSFRIEKKHWWAFRLDEGVVPDIVTMGKAMGNCLPVAGLVTTPSIGAALSDRMAYISTVSTSFITRNSCIIMHGGQWYSSL